MLSSVFICRADEVYTGGVTVDIDYEILGYLWIEEATVNLYPGAHIVNDYYMGDIYAASGAVLNIYGGQIDNLLIITTAYTDLPDAVVRVYGTDFAVDGAALEPGTTELFLTDQELSGRYEDGSSFAYRVDCYYETGYYLTLKLVWVDAEPPLPDPEPDIEVSQAGADFGQVEVDTFAEVMVTVSNAGTGPLTIGSLMLEQDTSLQFYTTALGQLPAVLQPSEQVDIGLLYAPAMEGQAAAMLVLLSDDPDEGRIEIALAGEGFVRMTPEEQMAAILDFFDQSVEDGTLEGAGRGRFAAWNLHGFRHMLKTADYLIEREKYPMAAQMLRAVQMKIDGQGHPWDWITGAAAAELNDMISALIEELNNQ